MELARSVTCYGIRVFPKLSFSSSFLSMILVLGLIGLPSTGSYEVEMIGNDVLESAGGPDLTDASAVFLLNQPFPKTGVLFAFNAYFRNSNPLTLQVWRPQAATSNSFELLGEIAITPSIVGSPELIYIVSQLTEKCLRVEAGDRLGISFNNSLASLVNVFDDNIQNPEILVYYMSEPSQPITINQMITFKTRVYPYDFSLEAYYYIDPNLTSTIESIDCPKNQLIQGDPTSTTTTPIPTGLPGPAGAPGSAGLQGGTGYTGLLGLAGPIGNTGQQGMMGSTGSVGHTGFTGPIGISGSFGPVGDTGLNGITGATGFTGSAGPSGKMGIPGFILYVNETESNNTVPSQSPDLFMTPSDMQWTSQSYMEGSLIWSSILSVILIILIILLILFTSAYNSKRNEVEDIGGKMGEYGMSNWNSNTLDTTLASEFSPRNITLSKNGGFGGETVKSYGDLGGIAEDVRDMKEESFANYQNDTTEKYATTKLKELPPEFE